VGISATLHTHLCATSGLRLPGHVHMVPAFWRHCQRPLCSRLPVPAAGVPTIARCLLFSRICCLPPAVASRLHCSAKLRLSSTCSHLAVLAAFLASAALASPLGDTGGTFSGGATAERPFTSTPPPPVPLLWLHSSHCMHWLHNVSLAAASFPHTSYDANALTYAAGRGGICAAPAAGIVHAFCIFGAAAYGAVRSRGNCGRRQGFAFR